MDEEIIEITNEDGATIKYRFIDSFSMGNKIYCLLSSASDGSNEIMRIHYKKLGADLEPIASRREKGRASLFYRANYSNGFRASEEEASVLYKILQSSDFRTPGYRHENIGDDMELISESLDGWWKPRFLLDNRNRRAVVFMNRRQYLRTITAKNINWNSLKGLDKDIQNRAKHLYAGFPTHVRTFINGTAEVEWQINPNGLYYMDDEGFGRTNDAEVALIGRIDRMGKAKCKFTCVRR